MYENIDKNTLLHFAVLEENISEIKRLLETNININAQNVNGDTALKLASQGSGDTLKNIHGKKFEIVKMLIEVGANVNISDFDNNSPLHVACSWSNYDIFSKIAMLLIEVGAEINLVDKKGRNALEFASNRSQEISLLLLEKNSEVNLNVLKNAFESDYEKLCMKLLEMTCESVFDDKKMAIEEKTMPLNALRVWYLYKIKRGVLTEREILTNLKENLNINQTWCKVCALYDFYLSNERYEECLHFDSILSKKELLIGHLYTEFPIYRIILYFKSESELISIIKQTLIYTRKIYFIGNWENKWKFLEVSERKYLEKQVHNIRTQMHKNFSYESWAIEERPFIFFEEVKFSKAKGKCALSGKKLSIGDIVYKFKNIYINQSYRAEYFYAIKEIFDSNSLALENKHKYLSNSYLLTDFSFHSEIDETPLIRDFWYNVGSLNILEILEFIKNSILTSSMFKHRYGNFLESDVLIQRENEFIYNDNTLTNKSHCEYMNIWYALIKCGYLDEIINNLPRLPEYVPYLLLCFDNKEIQNKVENYLQIDGIANMFNFAFKSYHLKNEIDLKRFIDFGIENPKVIENIAKMLEVYELHLYNEYNPKVDWYAQEFTHFTYAKGGGLLDFLIVNPRLLKPLVLLLDNGGELLEENYCNTMIFFIRTILLHTVIFKPKNIENLVLSLCNSPYDEKEIIFNGIEKKINKKTYNVAKKYIEKYGIYK